MTTILGIIPAKGRSRELPRKNLLELMGKPLIAYTIEAAQQADTITKLVVSTEDEEIAQIAGEYGVEVIERPANLSLDDTPMLPVVEHAISYVQSAEFRAEIVIILQPTSPLRNAQHINDALTEFITSKCDSLFSAYKVYRSYYWATNDNGLFPLNFDPLHPETRQNRTVYKMNGAIYITRCEQVSKNHCLLSGNVKVYLMPPYLSIDVDNAYDLWLCEQTMKAIKTKGKDE